VISLDLETHLIQPGLLSPPIVCGSVAPSGGAPQLLTPTLAVHEFKACLHTKGVVVVGANISFDFGCIAAVRPDLLPLIFEKFERGEVHDILIAQALDAIAKGYFRDKMIIDPRTGASIREPGGAQKQRFSQAICVDQVLGRTTAKENDAYRLSYATLEKVPMGQWPEVARKYPVDDAVNALEVAEAQLKTHENLHDLPFQARAAWAEHLAAMWGIRTDGKRVAALAAKLHTDLDRCMQNVRKLGVHRENGSKDTKVLKALVSAAYQSDPPLTETGAVSTSRDTLLDSGNEDLEAFAEVSKIEKLIGTYLPFLEQGVTKPINVTPNVLLANGRSSYDGLIQLLPRQGGVRECFAARPGTAWVSVDYSAIEAATLAQVCLDKIGYSRLAEAINAGKDVHSLFAAEIYGADYEDVVKWKETDPVWKDRRQMTKAANFGYPGCMGAFKFAQTKRKEGLKLCLAARTAERCGVRMIREWKGNNYPAPACEACVHQAEKLRLAFFNMWPEVAEYIKWITRSLDRSDRLTQLYSGRVRGGLTVPSAANTLFSGLAGDGAKRALWRISKECYTDPASALYGSRPIIFAHDEIILETLLTTLNDSAWRQTALMLEEMQQAVPAVKVSAEPAAMFFWDKSAKMVNDANGKLIPWEPK
jgi:DNA polymerase I-like protein with 3'-5' exonuclease and polymerase domains